MTLKFLTLQIIIIFDIWCTYREHNFVRKLWHNVFQRASSDLKSNNKYDRWGFLLGNVSSMYMTGLYLYPERKNLIVHYTILVGSSMHIPVLPAIVRRTSRPALARLYRKNWRYFKHATTRVSAIVVVPDDKSEINTARDHD